MLTIDSPRIDNFDDLEIPLKNHQLAVIYRTLELESSYSNQTDNNTLDINIPIESLNIEESSDNKETPIIQNESENNSNIIVLGDLPGAGKTNMVLGHIYYHKKKLLEQNPFLDEDDEDRDPTLIVVPQNILTQWTEAINRYFKKKLKVKKLVSYEEMMSLYKSISVLFRYDIILTTPLQYHMIVTSLKDQMVQVKRVIFDEIDTISSMIQSKVQADYVWFVSASFKNDRIGSYYSSITDEELDRVIIKCDDDFIRDSFPLNEPEVYKYISTNKFVDETLASVVTDEELHGINALDFTKMKNEYYKYIPYGEDGAVQLVVEENRNEIDFVKIRIEDIDNNIKTLKEQIDNDGLLNENINSSDDPKVKMYKEYTSRIITENKNLYELIKKRDIIRNKVSKNRICLICFQDIENKLVEEEDEKTTNKDSGVTAISGHTKEKVKVNMKKIFRSECCKTDYCVDCIRSIYYDKKIELDMKKKEEELKNKLNNKLSNQDEPINNNTNIEESKEIDWISMFEGIDLPCKKCDNKCLYNNYKLMKMIKRRSKEEKVKDRTTKIDRVEEILKLNQDKKNKYIIFSDFYNTFRYIKDLLTKLDLKYIELDGGKIETIDKAVKEYKEGDTDIMLSNSTFFGCGLNMEFTTDIIFMHKMEKGTERQVIGRAQRPGRTNTLRIHYIYYSNEEFGKDIEYESHTQFYLEDDDQINLDNIQVNEVVFE